MKYERVAQIVFNEPWAILPTKFLTITEFMRVKMAGDNFTQEEIEAAMGAATRASGASRAGAVAVLPLRGVMAQRLNMMEAMSGGTSTEMFGKMVKDAAANPEIGGIVLDIDSPGGSVFGVGELATIVADAKAQKPVVAMVNSMAASAAYWVASQASEIIITPGGQAGSIGVFTAHDDVSALLEAEGHSVTLISAGKKKVDGNPFGPLSDEAHADIQARVDAYYGQFTGAVAKGRGVSAREVREGFGEGAMVGAAEAVKVGLVDRVGTIETAIQKAGGRSGFQAAEQAAIMTSYGCEPGTYHHAKFDYDVGYAVCSCGWEGTAENPSGLRTLTYAHIKPTGPGAMTEVEFQKAYRSDTEPVDDTDARRRRLRLNELTSR